MNKRNMIVTTVIIGFITVGLCVFAYTNGTLFKGLSNACKTGVRIVPILFLCIIIIGMINSLNLSDGIKSFLGEETGIKGIASATLGGMITPGGTFVALPIAATLYNSGAGIGSVVSYIVAWATWDIMRLPFEVSFLGWKFVFIKWCTLLLIPILAGIMARFISALFNF